MLLKNFSQSKSSQMWSFMKNLQISTGAEVHKNQDLWLEIEAVYVMRKLEMTYKRVIFEYHRIIGKLNLWDQKARPHIAF